MFRHFAILFISIIVVSTDGDNEPVNPCEANSSVQECGTMCEPSCKNLHPKFCPRIVCTEATEACRCDDGFVRDPETGRCVRPGQCTTCPPGQALIACGTLCEGTCDAPYEPEICKSVRCFAPGCACDLNNDMVRDNSTDECVPISLCPQNEDCTTELDED